MPEGKHSPKEPWYQKTSNKDKVTGFRSSAISFTRRSAEGVTEHRQPRGYSVESAVPDRTMI